ncbi:GNAT family N-acetyltransferase [Kineosporia rhizophila]|nr:GNAT family N-acetyltransferase [Kineosporia rhizophila]MCE0538125.1 GNAT family N-acetyltransferase [Kineosporia rhizophila]
MAGHPSVAPDDFLVAEDPATGRPVASLVMLRQEWSLTGVRLPVVQVELVGVAPDHRGNQLTEKLFHVLHQRCVAENIPVQMIEGVPYFYRRLGYDYALAHGGAPMLPAPSEPAHSQLPVRPAVPTDAAALAAIDRETAAGQTLTCPRDEETWRYEISGRQQKDIARRCIAVLVQGDDVRGYLAHSARLSPTGELTTVAAACRQPIDWPQAAPALHEYLVHVGRSYAQAAGRSFTGVRPLLHPNHPLIRFGPPGVPRRANGWYVRAADQVDLLSRLQPVLRSRLQAAGLRWPEPTLVIDTYHRAAQLEFDGGELTAISERPGVISPSTDPGTHAALPPAALLHLVLGHRTLAEILHAWPDCTVRDRISERFLAALFPRVPVHVWPLG